MAHTENTIQNRKNKHLSPFERGQIAALHKAGHSNRDIARRLGRFHQTITNEFEAWIERHNLRRDVSLTQPTFPKLDKLYMRKTDKLWSENKLLVAADFVEFVYRKIISKSWSPDAVVGFAKKHNDWQDKPMVSTKMLYNYIDQCFLNVRNIDFPMKLKLNTKTKRVRKNRRVLGTRIVERPLEIKDREEFGHWEINTEEGKKSDDNALLTIVERKTRNYFAIKIDDQDHDSVDNAVKQLQHFFSDLFPQVFKVITSVNGSEFSNLSASLEGVTEVYFARSYAPYERGSNERNNGLLRRFIPKCKAISYYSRQAIQRIYQTINHLPRKILDYQQPAVAFEQELAKLA